MMSNQLSHISQGEFYFKKHISVDFGLYVFKTELSIFFPKAALLKLSKWQPHPCHKFWNHLWLLSLTSHLTHQQILLAREYIQNLITFHHLHCYLPDLCYDHHFSPGSLPPTLILSVSFQHSFKWGKIYLNEIEYVLVLIKIFQWLSISLRGKAAALTKSLQGPTTATFILCICDLISYNCVTPLPRPTVTLIRPHQTSYRFVPQDPSACCALCLGCLSPRYHSLQVWLNTSCSPITLGRWRILTEAFPRPLSVNHKLTFHISLFCFVFSLTFSTIFITSIYCHTDFCLVFSLLCPQSLGQCPAHGMHSINMC